MAVKELFRKALTNMLESDEFSKLAKYTEIKTDQKLIKRYEESLKEYGAENLPIISLIMNANADILRSALYFMIEIEAKNAE
jgi:hypothetical protein